MLRGLRVPVLFGMRLQSEVGLFVDAGAMSGRFVCNGRQNQGILEDYEVTHTDEVVRAIVEDKEVEAAIRAMDLSKF